MGGLVEMPQFAVGSVFAWNGDAFKIVSASYDPHFKAIVVKLEELSGNVHVEAVDKEWLCQLGCFFAGKLGEKPNFYQIEFHSGGQPPIIIFCL